MDHELTREEKNAIASLRRLANRWPDSLHAIVIDGDCIKVCKYGVPSDEICESVPFQTSPCAVLTDIHDDMNNGQS